MALAELVEYRHDREARKAMERRYNTVMNRAGPVARLGEGERPEHFESYDGSYDVRIHYVSALDDRLEIIAETQADKQHVLHRLSITYDGAPVFTGINDGDGRRILHDVPGAWERIVEKESAGINGRLSYGC